MIMDDILSNYESLHKYFHKSKVSNFDQECAILITLDYNYSKIKEHMVSLGGINETKTDLKIVLNRLASDKASNLIFAHNHTNGNVRFSKTDIQFTIALLYITDLMDVGFLDHILLPRGKDLVSMKEMYPKIFSKNWKGIFTKSVYSHLPNDFK